MIQRKVWSIFTRDGQYLGQYSAFAPETAFCEYMLIFGRVVCESEVACVPGPDDMHRITFEGNEYMLIPNL